MAYINDEEYTLYEIKDLLKKINSNVNKIIKRYSKIKIKGEIKINKKNYYGTSFDIIDKKEKQRCFLHSKFSKSPLENNKVYEIYGGLEYSKYGIQCNVVYMKKEEREVSNLEKLKEMCNQRRFFSNKKRVNFLSINKIAVLSKNGTQGCSDFIKQLKIPFKIKVLDVCLEGDNTEHDLIEKINLLQGKVDFIIIIRGGGSTTDISISFDKIQLFEVMRKSEIPIGTAIGHSNDTKDKLLITQVSDIDFDTPTTAAREINEKCKKFFYTLDRKYRRNYRDVIYSKINEVSSFLNDDLRKKRRLYKEKLYSLKQEVIQELLPGKIVKLPSKKRFIYVREPKAYVKYEIKKVKELTINPESIDFIMNISEDTESEDIYKMQKIFKDIDKKKFVKIEKIVGKLRLFTEREKNHKKLKPGKYKSLYLQKMELENGNIKKWKRTLLYYKNILDNIEDLIHTDYPELTHKQYNKLKETVKINETTDIVTTLSDLNRVLDL